jgi:cytochrome b subunit of formate dehydrogenase
MGPATNAATISTLWKIIGKKQLVVFLATLTVTALVAGILMHQLPIQIGDSPLACTSCEHAGPLQLLYAALLILVLLAGSLRPLLSKLKK